MEQKINNASLSFTCSQDWDAMKPDADGRFCNTCQKKVYDLTDKNTAYFIKIMQENNNSVCGRFTSDQLVNPPQPPDRPYWKRLAIAAMVFIGLSVAGQKAKSQQRLLGEPAPKLTEPDCDTTIMLGFSVMRIPPLNALHAYVVKKCKVPPSVNGRLIASFIVNKNGTLSKLAISDHLGEKVSAEVLRVLKNAPVWKNAERDHGRPYSLFIDFRDGKIRPYL